MKKSLLLIVMCAVMLLCSCSSKDYQEVANRFEKTKAFSLTAKNELSITENGETTQTTTALSLKKKQQDKKSCYQAIVTEDGEESVYYFQDGTAYCEAMGQKYRFTLQESEYLDNLCYAAPLLVSLTQGEKQDGTRVYSTELPAADYADTLLALNPRLSQIGKDSVSFSDFTYTASVKGKKIVSYSYAFTAVSRNEEGIETEYRNVLTVTVDSYKSDFTLPKDPEEYPLNESYKDYGLSQDEYNEQVLYVIFESLYNEDGTKSEHYEDYYQQFEELYGEEFMKQITKVADLYRGADD